VKSIRRAARDLGDQAGQITIGGGARRVGSTAECGDRLRRLLLASIAAMMLGMDARSDAEACRFAGTTDPSGKVAVTADVTGTNNTTQVDIAATFETTTMFWFPIHYLVEEVSIWRSGELETVGVNTRYLVGSHIVRQTWDLFKRDRDGMQGYRVQAKSRTDFQRRHPGFARHWDPSTFGQSWLDDYSAASPERRADLDLTTSPVSSNLLSPLALAFYWVRWLPPGALDKAVFLPGFKADKLVDVPMTAAAWNGGTVWRTHLRYPVLSKAPPSIATAWMLADRHLLQLALDLHEPRGAGSGTLTQEGCDGPPVVPNKAPQ
jgi:hypothetical protein